jgi:hypothetical protein
VFKKEVASIVVEEMEESFAIGDLVQGNVGLVRVARKISTFHRVAEVVNDLMGMNMKSDIMAD